MTERRNEPGQSSVRRWLVRLGLVLAVCLAGGVAGEWIVRRKVGAPMPERLPLLTVQANALRGFEMMPGLHYTYHHAVHVNALGLRGPELAQKQPGEVRVLFVGDSFVYGQGVGERETLPYLLEQELERIDPRGRAWTVVNGGYRGYDTRQELALIEELGPRIGADLVVLGWFWNDFLERDIPSSFARLTAKGPIVFDTGDRLEDAELRHWQVRQLVRRSALVMYLYDRFGQAAMEPFDDAFYDAGVAHLERYLGRYLVLAERQGFAPLVAILPDPNLLVGPHESQAALPRVRTLCAEAGLPFVEFEQELRTLAEAERRLPTLPYDGHYAPRANAVMARVAAPFVLEHAGP